MRKLKLIALMLACVMLISGCSLVSINEDRVANQVVATVNGENIYYFEVGPENIKEGIDFYLLNYYGKDPDSMDVEELQTMYDEQIKSKLDQLVLNKVMLDKAPELGIALTEEEKAENKKEAEEYYQDQKNSIIEGVFATPAPELAEETTAAAEAPAPTVTATPEPMPMPSLNAAQQAEVDEQYQAYIDSNGTVDEYYEDLNNSDIVTKVMKWIDAQSGVTDEEALEWYNSMLEQQKEGTESSVSAFETYVQEKNIITWVPADTVAVKQVFFKFDDADLVDEAKALFDNGQEDMAYELVKPMYDELKSKADEAYQRLLDGESMDDLIAEMGEDPGMDSDPGATCGYLVEARTTLYVKPFVDAALKLFNVGDISKPVESYMGIHVLQSIKVYKQGEVPFEDIKEEIKAAMLESAKVAKYDELTKQWLSEADITYYYDRLNTKND